MKRSLYLPLMLISVVVLFLAGNQLATTYLSGVRLDLTERGLYRLSPGSETVIDRLTEPVEWRFYYSRAEAAQFPAVRSYATRVRQMLESYEARAGGRIRLIEIDPEPFSEDEDAALEAGLVALPTETGERIFFGLVASNSVDDRAVIEVFNQELEARLEYELSRTIAEIERLNRPRLAILTSLELAPEYGAPSRFIAELNADYQLIWVEPDFETLPEAEALMVLHPDALTQGQLYLIDQFALARGRLLVFLDPMALLAFRTGPDGLPPLNAVRGSGLDTLLAHWGVGWDRQSVAMDRRMGLQVQVTDASGRLRSRAYPLWFAAPPDQMDRDDLATATLERTINFGSPGYFRPLEEAGLDFRPLIQTSAEGGRLDADIAAGSPSPDDLLLDYDQAPDPLILAARLSGVLDTAFPDGPPAGEIVFEPGAHRETSSGLVDIALVADADWLDDQFYVRSDPAIGDTLVADNLSFALNLVDIAAGDPALINLRSRLPSYRPMSRVDDLRAAAEADYLEIQEQVQDEIIVAQEALDALQASGQSSGLYGDSGDASLAEAARLRRQISEGRVRQREIERDFRRDIDALNANLQFWTIGVPPALIILIGVAGAMTRRRKVAV